MFTEEQEEKNIYEPMLPPWVDVSFFDKTAKTDSADDNEELYVRLAEGSLSKRQLEYIVDAAFEKIARKFPSYQERQNQIEMAKVILLSFYQDKSALIEAGTGIGKSFAYLVAAFAFSYLSGTRVCVSTETKNLQLQLFEKDIPFLQEALAPRFSHSLCLGSGNYVCALRYNEALDNGSYHDLIDESQEQEIRQWTQEAFSGKHNGSIYDLPTQPRGSFWTSINRDSDGCPSNRCSFFSDCNYYRARKRWAESRLLVVNHHLLLLHFLNDKKTLPPYGAVILDEAHGILKTGYSIFSLSFSQPSLPDIKKKYDKALRAHSSDTWGHEFLMESEEHWNSLLAKWADFFSQWEVTLDLFGKNEGMQMVQSNRSIPVTNMGTLAEEIQDNIASLLENSEDSGLQNSLRSINKFLTRLIRFVESFSSVSGDNKVFWGEKRNGILYLNSCNLQLGEEFSEFFSEPQLWTSATLGFWDKPFFAANNREKAAKGYFKNFIQEVLPLNEKEITQTIFDSPFQFEKQSMLYIPSHLPVPAYNSAQTVKERYEENLAKEIAWLSELAGGGSMALFTSNYRLQKVAELLPELTDLDVISQLDYGADTALQLFRQNPKAILLGSASFWQGVDISGEQLRLVIITQMMFMRPDDPIFKGRSQLLEKNNRKPFFEISLPSAGTMLRQAFGRLIRSEQDSGVVALLDGRLLQKSYGKTLIANLPPAHRVHDKQSLQKEIKHKKIFAFAEGNSQGGS